MRSALFGLMGCLCGIVGCSQAETVTPSENHHPELVAEKLRVAKHFAASEKPKPKPVVLEHRQASCQAKVGQPVHFTYGYVVVPDLIINTLTIKVNGEPVAEPELKHGPEGGPPGWSEITYVFRAERSGKYRVEVIPIYFKDDSPGNSWIVDVSVDNSK